MGGRLVKEHCIYLFSNPTCEAVEVEPIMMSDNANSVGNKIMPSLWVSQTSVFISTPVMLVEVISCQGDDP